MLGAAAIPVDHSSDPSMLKEKLPHKTDENVGRQERRLISRLAFHLSKSLSQIKAEFWGMQPTAAWDCSCIKAASALAYCTLRDHLHASSQ